MDLSEKPSERSPELPPEAPPPDLTASSLPASFAAPAPAQPAQPGALSALERIDLARALDRFEQRAIAYFLENRADTGLILDRAPNLPKADSAAPAAGMASIAATGYGLCAFALGVERGIIDRDHGSDLVTATLRFVLANTPASQGGWLAHFQHADSGATFRDSEISTIDTALFVLGALAAGEYFGGEAKQLAEQIFERLDFEMVRTNGGSEPARLSFGHGFRMANGRPDFLPHVWGGFSEGILVPLLALGSSSSPSPKECWELGWERGKQWSYAGMQSFQPLPLFTYFYPLGFLDLRDKLDSLGEDLWKQAQNAVAMQIAFCADHGYPPGLFGLTACDGPAGYRAYYPGHAEPEMTLAPLAILACLPLAEHPVYEALLALDRAGLMGEHHGIAASFDPNSGWVAPDTIGIDVGSALLMVDLYRGGIIQSACARSPIVRKALGAAGYQI